MARSLSPRVNQFGSGAVRGELRHRRVGLVRAAPALLLVDAPAEGVHDGVEVGADVQAVQGDVVGGVADDRDLGVRAPRRRQAAEESRAADPAGQCGDSRHGGDAYTASF